MSLVPVTSLTLTGITSASTGANGGDVPLHGRRLRILQALWVMLVLCDLSVLIISFPAFYRVLHSICTTYIASCESDQLNHQALAALQPLGISILNINNWPLLLGAWWLFIVFGGSLATQVYRYRRVASPVQRQQIKWLIYGFTPVILLPVCFGFVVLLFPALNGPDSLLHIGLEPLFRFYYLPIPCCIGIALLRYRLWDIDIIINRTLVYGLLTGILALLYFGLIIGLQSLFTKITGQTDQSPLIIVGTTLIIAALFQPLRQLIQNIIDRRFYRRKYNAKRTVANFSATLRAEIELKELSEQLVAVVEETMQPVHVSLWLNKSQRSKSPFYNEKDSAASAGS